MTAAVDGRLAEVTIDTLEKLAFLFASAVETPPTVVDLTFTSMRVAFTGEISGGLEVSLSSPVLAELAANMLGTAEGELSPEAQQDALKELANIICGNMLPVLISHRAEFAISAPYPVPPAPAEAEAPAACCHLMLENGSCRVRVNVDGGAWPPVDPACPGSSG
jgi:CheY-specific phosphatase CheX